MSESKILAKGDVIDGKYRIEGLIGRGGMGAVYRARHLRLDALRAIKLMRTELADDDEFVQRFHNEARLVESLRHANVVALYDYAMLDDGTKYIVWEYVEGETIREHLLSGKRFTPEETLDVVRQVASGLAAAHEQGILHRDVSPDNIMICSDGQAKVLDFGVAKTVGYASSAPSTLGLTFGKIGFASPEQRALHPDKALDARTDVFSLGAVTYAMLTGKAPFRTEDEPAFNHDFHVAPEAEVQRRVLSLVPDRCWHEPLRKALARVRAVRPTTVDAFVASLQTATDRHARGGCVKSERDVRRRWFLFAASAAAAISVSWCTAGLMVTTLPVLPAPPLTTPSIRTLPPVTTPDDATRQQKAAAPAPKALLPTPTPSPPVTAPDPDPESFIEDVAETHVEPTENPEPEVVSSPTMPIPERDEEPDPEDQQAEPVLTPARRVTYDPPEYPAIARRMGVQGDVIVRATITPEGDVTDIVVVRSIRLLDEAAVEAVRQWKFDPATQDGVPIAVEATLTVTFQLQ